MAANIPISIFQVYYSLYLGYDLGLHFQTCQA